MGQSATLFWSEAMEDYDAEMSLRSSVGFLVRRKEPIPIMPQILTDSKIATIRRAVDTSVQHLSLREFFEMNEDSVPLVGIAIRHYLLEANSKMRNSVRRDIKVHNEESDDRKTILWPSPGCVTHILARTCVKSLSYSEAPDLYNQLLGTSHDESMIDDMNARPPVDVSGVCDLRPRSQGAKAGIHHLFRLFKRSAHSFSNMLTNSCILKPQTSSYFRGLKSLRENLKTTLEHIN